MGRNNTPPLPPFTFLSNKPELRGSIRQVKHFKMSDVEDNTPEVQDEVEVSGDAPKGQMSVLDALKGVLKLALIHDGLALRSPRGFQGSRQPCRAHVCAQRKLRGGGLQEARHR